MSIVLGAYACSSSSGDSTFAVERDVDSGLAEASLQDSDASGCGSMLEEFDASILDVADSGEDAADSGSGRGEPPSPSVLPNDGGPLYGESCSAYCGGGNYSTCTMVDAGVASCVKGCFGGRRPENFRATKRRAGIGGYFAAMSALEAASVPAFERLARELAAHGAPESLIEAARAARRDEARHTKMMASLASRFGVEARRQKIEVGAVRSLEAIAKENAVEGCVRETFGALTAHFQAEHATDPQIKRVMKIIARDETRHAELAYRVANWLEKKLDPKTTTRIVKARTCATKNLIARFSDPPPACASALGLPSRDQARALFAFVAPQLGLAA